MTTVEKDPFSDTSEGNMWYLLVAAGAGILAQQWQNTHKGQRSPPTSESHIASTPASAPGTSHGGFTSMNFSNDSLPLTSDSGIMEKEGPSIDPKASFAVGSTIEKSSIDVKASFVIGSTKEGPSIDPKVSFIIGNSKSSLSHFMGYESQQGLSHDVKCGSSLMKSNKRSAHEAFIDNNGFGPMEGRVNIDMAKIKTAVEHGEEPSSPSSCCSSSSTVVNSPVGNPATMFQEEKGGFDASEHPEETQSYGGGACAKLGVVTKAENSESHYQSFGGALSKRTPSSCVSPGVKDGGMSSWAPELFSTMPSTSLPSTKMNMVSDASTQLPYLFTAETQEGSSKTAFYRSNAFYSCNQKSDVKHSMLDLATDTSPSKVKSLSPSHSATAVENLADLESDSRLNFGLAMGVFLMVSSSKREMEKMGKVLKETEDLVSDMRKELEERKAHSSCMSSVHVGEASNGGISAAKKNDAHKGVRDDDESVCSIVRENHVRMCDLEAELEAELQLINTYSQASNSSLKWEDHSDGYGSHEFRDNEVSSTFEQVGENDLIVSTIDLERKLWKIFQERQEEKIHELEEALELALSKLQAKDEELRWWKNRASWLMQHTFGSRRGENKRLERFEGLITRHGDEAHEVDEQIMYKVTPGEVGSLIVGSGGNEVCHKNSAGHGQGLVRVGSTCSLSSEESVLSYEVRTFTYPDYKGS